MKSIYIITNETGTTEKSMKTLRGYCNYLRYEGVVLCPQLTFSYMDESDRDGWFRERRGQDLLDLSTEVYVFADELTELMMKEIRYAQKYGKEVHFHDASGKEIDYDSLIINEKIGPGYRKIIAEAHGETCCSGICPYGAECCTKAEPEKVTETVSPDKTTAGNAKEKKSFLQKLFARH